MGCSGEDHLAVIAGIREQFLVSGHARGEHQFPEGFAFCAEGTAVEETTILERE